MKDKLKMTHEIELLGVSVARSVLAESKSGAEAFLILIAAVAAHCIECAAIPAEAVENACAALLQLRIMADRPLAKLWLAEAERESASRAVQ